MVGLDERHHTFIQALMTRGPLPEKDSKNMFRALFQSESDGFFDFIATLNKALDFVQMEVKDSANQYDGMVYYGIVNKLASEQAKLGTCYTHAQITFFKAIVVTILQDTTGLGVISNMDALNLRLNSQVEQETQGASSSQAAVSVRLSLGAKEETLASLILDRWLTRTANGSVGLGVRAFLELRSMFRDFDVPICDVCNEAGIKAQPCRNANCNVRMHSYCLPRKFSIPQARKVCPVCGTLWRILARDNYDGNDAEEEEEDADIDTADSDEADQPVAQASKSSMDTPQEPVRQLQSRPKLRSRR